MHRSFFDYAHLKWPRTGLKIKKKTKNKTKQKTPSKA